jgi:alkylhydroperoxidase family enzyme
MDVTDWLSGGAESHAAAARTRSAPEAPDFTPGGFIDGQERPLSRLLSDLDPRVMRGFEALQGVAWEATDPALLELCRLRLSDLMGDSVGLAHRTPAAVAAGLDEAKVADLTKWWKSPAFDEREKAHLAFAEQFNMSVADVGDAEIEALLAHSNAVEVCEFVAALYAVEFEIRIRMVASAVLLTEVS